MSIRRIESSYAHCLGEKDLSMSDMAVLIALSYCANSETEKCFPSTSYLMALTHASDKTIARSCKHLRNKGLITWKSGRRYDSGCNSNAYTFLFPITKMPSKEERYQRINGNAPLPPPCGGDSVIVGGTTPTVGENTPNTGIHIPHHGEAPTPQWGSNTEGNAGLNASSNQNSTPKFKTEDSGVLSGNMFDVAAPKMNFGFESFVPSFRGLVERALALCGVSGEDYQFNSFSKIMSAILDVTNEDAGPICAILDTFESQKRNGELRTVDNLAAVLMARFQRKHAELKMAR